MAPEVPAKEVLCEAMEYLSKLGSNLRTRSDNLRNKKIRSEKLNNVLAVQKAASKILLVCELSKKSLENVETGVRKVLELIDTSQASSSEGGKKPNLEKDYYCFEYKSRKLRIRKRISLKHYTSVRVVAKSIPKSMMDNYPVHYDCKLYRLRQRETKLNKDSKSQIIENAKEGSTSPPNKEGLDVCEKRQINNTSIISIPDTPTLISTNKNKRNSVESLEDDVSIINIPVSPTSKSFGTNKRLDKNVENDKRRKSSGEFTDNRSHSRDNSQSPRKNKSQRCNSSERHKSKDREKYNNDKRSSEGSMAEHRKNSESGSKSDNNEDRRKKVKKLRVVEDSSDDEVVLINEKESVVQSFKDNDSNESYQEPKHKKQKLDESAANDYVALESSAVDDQKTKKDNEQAESANVKPMIKCVSLSKLLKPDILKEKVYPEVEINSTGKLRKTSNEDKAKNDGKAEEYWAQKRKEVSSFKAKNFVINVTRLPELSLDYLKKLNLKKITQGGVIIVEHVVKNSDEVDNVMENNNETIHSKSKKVNKTKNNDIKCAEGSDYDLIAAAHEIKISLLHESDSDNCEIRSDKEKLKSSKKDTENIKSVTVQAQKAKSALSNESDINSGPNEPKAVTAQTEKVKNTFLNDSVSDLESNITSEAALIVKKKTIQNKYSDSENSTPKLSESVNNETNTENGGANKSISRSHSEKSVSNIEDNDKMSNEKDSGDIVEKNNDHLSECQRNEKTPERAFSGDVVDKAKSSLLNDSPEDKIKTPLSERMTPQSRKKRMRERMHAKKMMLTYSSSDTEDEQLKEVLKEIKDSLLHASDEEKSNKKQEQKHQSTESSTSSSAEDMIKKVKKKITYDAISSKEKSIKHSQNKHRRRLDSEDSTKDGNSENSKSSSSKMVRSKSKPGNSSSHNSDAQDTNDKDIDGLTNLDTLNKPKTRRRNSSGAEMTEESVSAKTKTSKQRKPTGLICAEILKAESSSESSLASGDEHQDESNDIPPVTLPSFNGAVDHLVKEDLLEESNSSSSRDESANKDDSDDEAKLNARRRKANAISSDSEVGSSRKKDADVRISDFEESEDSDFAKRGKKKKNRSDSDASAGTTSSTEARKKKRRRIKSLRDSDASGSDSENEGKNKHGRKNIRKVMGKNQLEEATKKAAREEKERIARIAERQKIYNNLEFDESGKPDEVLLDKVVLDFDPETKEPLIEVDRGLVKKLKPHQANGIKFMWDACFESVKRIKKDRGSGCILAHCMGLGKTLQVVTLTHTLLTHGDLTRVNRVLVVCPLSTVLNWVNEFRMWLKYAEAEYEVDVYELSRYKQNSERAFQLSQWFQHGGVCVLGYEMFRNLSADNLKKFKKKMLKNFQEALVDPGPDLVVCDEGHLLKNEKTSLSQSMNRVRTHRRIVLTGTPLQNNLKEYYCMVQFVKPNLLGKYNEYLNRFVNPITNGQYTDSTEHDIKIMKRRSHVLHKMLDGAVQRRDYGVLAPFLPPKHEYVLFITLSEVQTKLYQHYLDNFSRRPLAGKSSGFLFPDFQSLQRIWTHPLVLKYNSERYEIMQQKKRDKEEEDDDSEGSLVNFIDDDSTPRESSTEESMDYSSDMSDDSRKKSKKKKAAKKSKGKDKEIKEDGGQSKPRRGTRANPIDIGEDDKVEEIMEVKNENPTEWWIKLVEEDELEDMRNSHKLVLLFDILRQCDTIGDKLLVFSQSLYSLDLIEHFLGKVDEATQEGRIDEKLGGHVGSWAQGVDYFRLDGSTSCENRSIWCKNFNREDNPRARLFLISTRAGGLGINLVAANRVVIFDVSWNPSHDVQSIFRVYRFGQKKPCYVYRFLAMGTMEEKIYERQVTKQAISKRVIDEQQIDRHYAENDLAELYKFEPSPPTPRPIPPLPKDRLFAEMLREHEAQIYKYHEHDSLLENKEEETLSEEERKAAWEDFENEKNRPPPPPLQASWTMPNGMSYQGLIAQQQQLQAFAAMAAALRKERPNLNDNQLMNTIAHIYNSNPQMFGGFDYGLSESFKYAQPGLMNPAMMNPGVMNAASGVAGLAGMGNASGLQYEPPWQRQHQQQHQMRLQQLLQQQNPMGAKFYAGGLGSRDPVAMALQQQRAREIMLSGGGGGGGAAGAGRPRGRPPLQPRAPPSNDIVNLDSD